MVIGANVHAIGYSTLLRLPMDVGKAHLGSVLRVFTVYKWTLAGNISQEIVQPYACWGLLALTCFDLLGFFSIQYIRTRYYNFFFGTHVAGLVVALFAVSGSYLPPLAQLTAYCLVDMLSQTSLYPFCYRSYRCLRT